MTAERKGPMIFGIPGTDDASAAAAVSRMGGFTERDKDIALEMAIRGVVSDAWRKPPPTASSTSQAPLPRGTGWHDPGPLRPPPGIALIDAMCDALLGPAIPRPTKPAEPTASPAPATDK
jgi:hypothetical protein